MTAHREHEQTLSDFTLKILATNENREGQTGERGIYF